MDERKALATGTQLVLNNSNGHSLSCYIIKEIGRGSTSIVYEGAYVSNTGDEKIIRIKECYPYKLKIIRDASGRLIANGEDEITFSEAKDRFQADFSLANLLFYSDGLYDSLVTDIDIYDLNNSKYIVSTYSTSTTLAQQKPATIKQCVEVVSMVTKVIEKIHNAGYLYLDIKPDNILYINNDIQSRVQLFDFDSLIPYGQQEANQTIPKRDFRISYSKGFAAVELRTANLKRIGPATDVFGIGALFFYLLFGAAPTALCCENDACFSETQLVYNIENCDDRIMLAISDFLHKSLASYSPDRYQTMRDVIEQLSIILSYADEDEKRVFSSRLYKDKAFTGRDSEIQEIDEYLADDASRCLFVSGIGGIGKSTLIRQYLYERKERFKGLYVIYNESIKNTINNDAAIRINKVAKVDVENDEIYFERKLKELRLLVTEKTLLVIDNFDGVIDSDFLALLELRWKVIVVSRQTYKLSGSNHLEIKQIKDRDKLIDVFQFNLGRQLESAERPIVEQMINEAEGHTLVIELIAKQISSSHIRLADAAALVTKNGFSNIAPERVDFEKDSIPYVDTIGNIIDALFQANRLSLEEKTVLKIISLLGVSGMSISQLFNIMEWKSYQCVNDLQKDGWIVIEQEVVTMHPVIQEAVARWKWEAPYLEAAEKLLSYFYIEIRIESSRNDFPAYLKKIWLMSSENPQLEYSTAFGRKIANKTNAFWDRVFSASGLTGKLIRARYSRMLDDSPADNQRLLVLLNQAKVILNQCNRVEEVRTNEAYLSLLYQTVLNMPLYNEEYVFAGTKEIIDNHLSDFVMDGTSELIAGKEYKNPVSLVKLLHIVACLYAENNDFDEADELIHKAEQIARESKNKRALAQYYDLLSEYYDIKLSGAYAAETDEEKRLYDLMYRYTKRCMQCSKKFVKTDESHLYIKSALGLITFEIRGKNPSRRIIGKQLEDIEKYVFKYTLRYASVRYQFWTVCAWYYALINKNVEVATIILDFAALLYEQICPNDLAKIDCLLIPTANIYFEVGEYKKASDILGKASEICKKYPDVVVYVKRNIELLSHMLQVAMKANDFKSAGILIQQIDLANADAAQYGIHEEISEETRKQIAQNT